MDIGTIFSIIGFLVTCFLYMEARKIRMNFINKVRIPEIVRDLDKLAKELIDYLKDFESEKNRAHQKIGQAKAILESTLPKLRSVDKENIVEFINDAKGISLVSFDKDEGWAMSTKLSGIVAFLQQRAKDSKWDNV